MLELVIAFAWMFKYGRSSFMIHKNGFTPGFCQNVNSTIIHERNGVCESFIILIFNYFIHCVLNI